MSTQSSDQPIPMTIRELADNQTRYIVPIYQRNYAWGKDEIDALVQDISTAQQRNAEQNYYIGSLVVYKRHNGSYEAIDGQQRLTTLSILLAALNSSQSIKLSFEHRTESDAALARIRTANFKPEKNSSIERGFELMSTALKEHNGETEEFKNFLMENVCIIRTEVPADTDLNHYFEIMNNRGEQLEKHEVLKSKMMALLPQEDRHAFAAVWDACSDMQRYAVMGIEASVRKKLFSKNWEIIKSWEYIPQNFDQIRTAFTQAQADQHTNKDKDTADKSDTEDAKLTLSQLLARPQPVATTQNQKDKDNETDSRFESVIDFPNFLMHVYRIYGEADNKEAANKREILEEIQLDEKNLLDTFQPSKPECQRPLINNPDSVRKFLTVLLQCRLLFDRYVIKSDLQKEDGSWSLLYAKPQDKSSMSYNNSFENEEDNKTIIMLQAMFHVSQPSRIYKNWLYAVLRALFRHQEKISAKPFENFLNKLSDKFYFGRYGENPLDFLNLILGSHKTLTKSANWQQPENVFWNNGTGTPHFVFTRLEYALWKHHKEFGIPLKKADEFYFAFRNSVEHFQPQTDLNQNEANPAGDALNHFGNLCLLSHSDNSKLSNSPPQAKKALMGRTGNIPSLKQFVMMQGITDESQEWDEEKIAEHGKAMIELLNRPFYHPQ